MNDITFTSINGSKKVISSSAIDAFKAQLAGSVYPAGEPGYQEARSLWNAMIDKQPAMVVNCSGTADVVACVKFARENNLLTCVKGGGHNIAGLASADGALMINLSPMKSVSVNASGRTAKVGAGCTLRNVDHETQAYGMAVPLGINSTTGIAGLTLGGGFGWLSRSYGLTADNLLSAEVVTADGKITQAGEGGEADLLWALQGGGGNFGIVTSFTFRLHPVGPQVLAGLIIHPFKDAPKVFRYYNSFVSNADDKLTCWCVLRKAPPLPFLPQDVHGKEVFVIAAIYAGGIKEGEKALEPLRKFGQPIADVIGTVPFEGWQQSLDPLLTPGFRNYWKSHNFVTLSDELMDTLLDYTTKLPSPHSEIFLGQLGGQINRLSPDATAYPHRDANFVMNIHARWQDKPEDDRCAEWARKLFDATAKYSTGGVYVNFISEGEQLVSSAFGKNMEKLSRLKAKYDPDNFFRTNQNIKPKA